jgi:hypothetical protein
VDLKWCVVLKLRDAFDMNKQYKKITLNWMFRPLEEEFLRSEI